jgi:hypothetical protein
MIRSTSDGVAIAVRVVPRAGRSGLAGTRGDSVLVRLTAAPVDGSANDQLIDVLAEALGVARRAVVIASGARSRHKIISVTGVSVDEARTRLGLSG